MTVDAEGGADGGEGGVDEHGSAAFEGGGGAAGDEADRLIALKDRVMPWRAGGVVDEEADEFLLAGPSLVQGARRR